MHDGKNGTGNDGPPATEDEPPGATFRTELRRAVTPRATILLCGVLLLEIAFVVSFIGAFHSPRPRDLAVAVVAPGQAQAGLIDELNALPGEPLAARAAESASEARAMVLDRRADAALLAGPGPDRLLVASAGGPAAVQSLQAVFEKTGGGDVVVTDLRPPHPADGRGLSSFYLVLGVVIGGYLASAALSASYGARPANPHLTVVRLLALAALSVVSGLAGVIVVDPVFHALPGHFGALWGIATLITFAAAAAGMAFQVLLGTPGIALSVLVFVVLGNPSAGGVYPSTLLPPFWSAIGQALPNGAGVTLVRNYAYFGGHGTSAAWWVLAAWAAGGVLISCLASFRRPPGADLLP
ncbi:ABC transporter permease [Streptomyces pilosus]|uniref:Membrane protein n=1 Tax=Streptomyces pilosus TaxID=28893 RepID=A0A918BWI6_9ACTN|nr:ABC transporter permease [Streptomyces pilosus]GGQ93647.1 membrane protein [Streptomyces pilosus]GGV46806.1 membrane protein [Streptomyces pilosus]